MKTISLHNSTSAKVMIAFILTFCLTVIGQVNAAFISCRSDPIVWLSDGTRLQFGTVVETSLDDLIGIRYELHVPAGVTIDRIIYTPAWARNKETVVLVNDQAAGDYSLTTLVQTGTANVPVTIKGKVLERHVFGRAASRQTATGFSGQALIINF
jgi:hypothetical protein